MKHHIVAIGISKHKNSAANLAFAEKDASEFFTLFAQNIGEIGYNKLLIDQEATLSEMKTALGKELLEAVGPDDAFFFFYSGHGALVADPSDTATALSFLVPYDATHDIANTCLSVDYLKGVFQSLQSRANLVFVDSCFSGSVSKNGKSYPLPNAKSFKNLKSFSNTVIGNGSVIFTASKDDEISLEDPEYGNGIFTHHLLEELQKTRPSGSFSAMDIFSPIVSGVMTRAKDKWHHVQTPTFSGKLEGDLILPVFKKRLILKPDIIEIPKTPALQEAPFSVPRIDLSEEEKEKLLEDTIDFVMGSSGGNASVRAELAFERLCHQLVRKIKTDWEQIFHWAGGDTGKIPEAISKLEAGCYQFMVLGGPTAVYGTDRQMSIYSKCLVSLFKLTGRRAGLVVLVAVPEVIVLEAIYSVAVICVARESYGPLQILLETKFDHPDRFEDPPMNLLSYSHIHYTRALTGYATKVNEHVREYLKSQEWLFDLAPSLEGATDDYQLQANFLLSMLTEHSQDHLWPDYARFYGERIIPFAKKLIYDRETREQIGKMMGLKENEVLPKFRQYMQQQQKRGLDRYWWESIREDYFLTEEEKGKAATGK